MKEADRRAARTAYRERAVVAGIFAVRCAASGEVWVGRAPNLGTVQNRLWFALRQGAELRAGLQAAWDRHGPASFAFEALEEAEEKDLPYARDAWLKDRQAHWQAALGATPL